LLKSEGEKPVRIAKLAADPVVAASPDGKFYAIAWKKPEGEKTMLPLQSFPVK
jgi:hypothetical protein